MTTIITIKEGSDRIGGRREWEVDSGPFGHDSGGRKTWGVVGECSAGGLVRQAGHGKSGIDWGMGRDRDRASTHLPSMNRAFAIGPFSDKTTCHAPAPIASPALLARGILNPRSNCKSATPRP
jgi:hypothetical protein